MTPIMYFVSDFLHFKENDGWVYKCENRFSSLSAAEKSFHKLIGNNVDDGIHDVVTVLLTDSLGNTISSYSWIEPTQG